MLLLSFETSRDSDTSSEDMVIKCATQSLILQLIGTYRSTVFL